MTTPFADASDLASMGFDLSNVDVSAATQLLEDASDYLRGVIGSQLYPVTQSTITLWSKGDSTRIQIPLVPLISVDSVSVQYLPSWPTPPLPSVQIAVVQFDQCIVLRSPIQGIRGPAKVTVTATHGYSQPPGELKTWACVLAANALKNLQEHGSFTSGDLTSIAMEDYKATYTDNVDASRSPFALPQAVVERLQAQYGGGAYVTDTEW